MHTRKHFRLFNDGASVADLRAKLGTLNAQAKDIQNRADAEKRDLTADETKTIEGIFNAFESTEAEIARRERMAAIDAKLGTANRVTSPAAPAPTPGIEIVDRIPKGQAGFNSFGDFARAVRASVRGHVDNRLMNALPPNYGSEGVNTDGGYAVPPDFRATIVSLLMAEESLIARTDRQTTSGNAITFPMDADAPHAASGVQAYWEAEAAQHTASKPVLGTMTVRLNKLAAIVPATDELLEDVPALSGYLTSKVATKLDYKINEALLSGTGVGEPLGILKSAAKVTVAKETNQTKETINYQNILKMWARMYAPARRNAIWLINQDVEVQLAQLAFPNASGSVVPVYLPPGGVSGSPYATLFGRPVIATELANVVGTEGDIILFDPSSYLTVTKGGLKQDVSIHVWFEYDITAFRFVMRMGGQPWWTAPMARRNGTNTLSPIVTLADRG